MEAKFYSNRARFVLFLLTRRCALSIEKSLASSSSIFNFSSKNVQTKFVVLSVNCFTSSGML